jgi:hypothetical protein
MIIAFMLLNLPDPVFQKTAWSRCLLLQPRGRAKITLVASCSQMLHLDHRTIIGNSMRKKATSWRGPHIRQSAGDQRLSRFKKKKHCGKLPRAVVAV